MDTFKNWFDSVRGKLPEKKKPVEQPLPTEADYLAADAKADPRAAEEKSREQEAQVSAARAEVDRLMAKADELEAQAESDEARATEYVGTPGSLRESGRLQKVTEEVFEEPSFFTNLDAHLKGLNFTSLMDGLGEVRGKSQREEAIVEAALGRFAEVAGQNIPPIYKEDVRDLILARYKEAQTKSSATTMAEREKQMDLYRQKADKIVRKHAA